MNEIPEEIKRVFAGHPSSEGEIVLLGSKDGVDYYRFRYFEDLDIGFPTVYGYDGGDIVVVVTGFEALDLIGLFVKD